MEYNSVKFPILANGTSRAERLSTKRKVSEMNMKKLNLIPVSFSDPTKWGWIASAKSGERAFYKMSECDTFSKRGKRLWLKYVITNKLSQKRKIYILVNTYITSKD